MERCTEWRYYEHRKSAKLYTFINRKNDLTDPARNKNITYTFLMHYINYNNSYAYMNCYNPY